MSETTTNSSPAAIEMRNLALGAMRDQNVGIAEAINWTVNAGELWVVAGPQRSGKSDFLMLAGGLMSPTRGTYRCFGAKMPIFEEERLAERLRLGLVFDGGQLFNHMTVAENVALPLRYHENLTRAEAEPRVQAMLELMELSSFANRVPSAIARNWQKRAGLARALMLRPDVLLLDNPLARLDARHANWWLNFLSQLGRGQTAWRDRPMTLVATSESFRAWREHASHFALLNDGKFTAIGNRAALEASADALVRELLAVELPQGWR
ncbi:MAG: ATP-binding cassette domain-containing protein [Verrucomicrobia bacterium]|jgi:ABC-type transporter Mla maintaining outer membrane lipid asymmetry ATPase subunit MlaF|nr:ATP-binding cassette domain-containing protein [Verrucomicrobiota bacterium]